MTEKTQKQFIAETYQAVFGVPGTEEKGIAGDLKDIKKLLVSQNERYQKLSNKVNWVIGVLSATGAIGGGIFGMVQALT